MGTPKILTRKQRRAAKRMVDAVKKRKKIALGGMNANVRMKAEVEKTGKSAGYTPYSATKYVKYKYKK